MATNDKPVGPGKRGPGTGSETPDVERLRTLMNFAVRARILILGQGTIRRSFSSLQWVWIATDLSARGRREAVEQFCHYPVVEWGDSDALSEFCQAQGVKVVGMKKSDLAKNIYALLKPWRVATPCPDEGA